MPTDDKFRYTDEHPYISNGKGRNSVESRKYTKVEADVCEFEDTYFNHPWNGGINKMGLGIDEYCDACIQFARKNYADLMPDGKTKKVGNTIKSRKMSGYLEKFIDVGVDQLLHGDGYDFLEGYYEYISKIYNYQIPIKDIASKGKIKKTIEEYKADCQSVTKAGNKKSRQAWYELVIKNNINVNVSDTIYYINTGKKLSDKDVKRVTHQYVKVNGEEKILDAKTTKELLTPICQKKGIEYKNLKTKDKKEMIKPFITREEDEIILNSQLVPSEILNSDEDVLCSDIEGLEYNVDKYIDQFNKRIKPLLVCFSPEIRNDIIITKPDDRKFFTKEQTKLVCGYPNKESDQDTYDALMTPERKEIEFWLKVGKIPPFVKECGIDWDKLVEEYKITKKDEDNALFQEENEKYLKALDELTQDDIDAFMEDGKLPSSITSIVTMDSTMHFYFKKIPNKTPTTGGFVFDDIAPSNIETVEE